MPLKSDTLRPGFLVSLKTSTRGNVDYRKTPIKTETRPDGSKVTEWETTRIIVDPEEHERGQKARAKARSVVASVCKATAFGMLCPTTDAEDLERAIKEARETCREFNTGSALTKIGVYVLTGRIESNDAEAVKAINSEVADLMQTMQEGIEGLDVKVVRDAASKLKEVGAMLPPVAEATVRIAIDTARETARRIVKAGEQAAQEVDRAAIRKIAEQRTAFLDLDGEQGEVAVPQGDARALDLAPEEDATPATAQAAARELEIEEDEAGRIVRR
jgi:hypothetical protein